MAVGVGDAAPDFTLPGVLDGERTEFSLSAQRGRSIVLVLYPADGTPVCTAQLIAYTDDLAQFTEVGATVWGISPQDLESHEAFAAEHGLGMPLLADVDTMVFGAYGALGPLGVPRRAIFVVDAEGVIRYRHVAYPGVTFRPSSELVDAVRRATV